MTPTVWVLILVLDYYGPAVTSQEYTTQATCEKAGKVILKSFNYLGGGRHGEWICTPK